MKLSQFDNCECIYIWFINLGYEKCIVDTTEDTMDALLMCDHLI